MRCDDVKEALSAYIDDQLSEEEKLAIEGHLRDCPGCSHAVDELKQTISSINRIEEVEPPAWLAQKIMARVREEAAAKRGFLRKLFFPLHIKIPLQAAVTLAVAVTAFVIFRTIEPEVKKTSLELQQDRTAVQQEAVPAGEKPGHEPPAVPDSEGPPGGQQVATAEPQPSGTPGAASHREGLDEYKRSYARAPERDYPAENRFTLALQTARDEAKGEGLMGFERLEGRTGEVALASGVSLEIDVAPVVVRTFRQETPYYQVGLKVSSYSLHIPESFEASRKRALEREASNLVEALNSWETVLAQAEFVRLRQGDVVIVPVREPLQGLRYFERTSLNVAVPWKDEWN